MKEIQLEWDDNIRLWWALVSMLKLLDLMQKKPEDNVEDFWAEFDIEMVCFNLFFFLHTILIMTSHLNIWTFLGVEEVTVEKNFFPKFESAKWYTF